MTYSQTWWYTPNPSTYKEEAGGLKRIIKFDNEILLKT